MNSEADVVPVIPPNGNMSSLSEMSLSPTSVASSGHFSFTAPEISGIGVDTSALDTAFTSDMVSSVGLQLSQDGGAGNSRDSLRSLDQIQWNFNLDFTTDLSNLGGNFYTFSDFKSLLLNYFIGECITLSCIISPFSWNITSQAYNNKHCFKLNTCFLPYVANVALKETG